MNDLMINAVEIGISLVVGYSLSIARTFAPKRLAQNKEKKNGVYPWLWRSLTEYSAGFICPKCDHRDSTQPKYCECEQYWEPHYHFVCQTSGSYTDSNCLWVQVHYENQGR